MSAVEIKELALGIPVLKFGSVMVMTLMLWLFVKEQEENINLGEN